MSYQLMWSEEFENEGLPNSQKWQLITGGHGFNNNEQQYYTDCIENAQVGNGVLSIVGINETFQSNHYTSAKLSTYGKKSFLYGRLRIKAKLPKGEGTWPAIWMLPDSFEAGSKWPECGEIDIAEHIGRKQDELHFSLHTGGYNHLNKNQYTHKLNYSGLTDRYVEYGIDWDEDCIAFYMDSECVKKFVKGEEGKSTDVNGWPFDQPFHLIINLALGGYWGGEIEDSALPAQMDIAYVRYYEWVTA